MKKIILGMLTGLLTVSLAIPVSAAEMHEEPGDSTVGFDGIDGEFKTNPKGFDGIDGEFKTNPKGFDGVDGEFKPAVKKSDKKKKAVKKEWAPSTPS